MPHMSLYDLLNQGTKRLENPPLQQLAKDHRHGRRVRSVGMLFGVDLDRLTRTKVVSPDLLETLTVRCIGCSHPEACKCWISKNEAGETTDSLPHFCRNADLMRRIFNSDGACKPRAEQPSNTDEAVIDDDSLQELIHKILLDAA